MHVVLGAAPIVLLSGVLSLVFAGFVHVSEVIDYADRLGAFLRPAGRKAALRPIEDIARDARRLGRRFRHPSPGERFVKSEGIRRAYDAALAEGCLALGIDHLLGVLPPGRELDLERLRVEAVLGGSGIDLDDAA